MKLKLAPLVVDEVDKRMLLERKKTILRYPITDEDVLKGFVYAPSGVPYAFMEKDIHRWWDVMTPCRYRKGDEMFLAEEWKSLPVRPDGYSSGNREWMYYRMGGDLRPTGWKQERWEDELKIPPIRARRYYRVKEAWVDRLFNMTEAQLRLEGFPTGPKEQKLMEYCKLWDKKLGGITKRRKFGWRTNPVCEVYWLEELSRADVFGEWVNKEGFEKEEEGYGF